MYPHTRHTTQTHAQSTHKQAHTKANEIENKIRKREKIKQTLDMVTCVCICAVRGRP